MVDSVRLITSHCHPVRSNRLHSFSMSTDIFGPGIISTVGMYCLNALPLTVVALNSYSLNQGRSTANNDNL